MPEQIVLYDGTRCVTATRLEIVEWLKANGVEPAAVSTHGPIYIEDGEIHYTHIVPPVEEVLEPRTAKVIHPWKKEAK
jgi:hypothetical protein